MDCGCSCGVIQWTDADKENHMDMSIAGRRVLITGASQGIGEGLARAFAREGCRVSLVARSADKLAALAHELRVTYDVKRWRLSHRASSCRARAYPRFDFNYIAGSSISRAMPTFS
jgi:FlaA1/EpsC-like NDP-sugar epimerase